MAAGGTITGPVVNALEIVVGRQIVGRIRVEKAIRLQHEACIFDRHHREVFGLADMGMAKAVPHYDVGIIDVAILSHITRKSITAGMDVGIIAARILLGWIVPSDPYVLGGKAASFPDEAALLSEHQRRMLDGQLVACGMEFTC